jgi:hypothetical protein
MISDHYAFLQTRDILQNVSAQIWHQPIKINSEIPSSCIFLWCVPLLNEAVTACVLYVGQNLNCKIYCTAFLNLEINWLMCIEVLYFGIMINGIKANRSGSGLFWSRLKMNLPAPRSWSRKLGHSNFVNFQFVSLEIRTQSPLLRNGTHVASSNIVNWYTSWMYAYRKL